MRKTTIINVLIAVSCWGNLSYGAFGGVINETPLLDGKTLSGHEVTTPFSVTISVTKVDPQKQLVFKLEDTLRDIASKGNFVNDSTALNSFSTLNQLACQANVYALGFFASLFQEGTLGRQSLPNFSRQPERAALFKTIQELSIAYLSSQSESDRENILKEINCLLRMQKLFDFILGLENKDLCEYNVIVSEIVQVLVSKFGKSQSELASKFGISRSSIRRIYHKQALVKKATSPISVGRVFKEQRKVLQEFLELNEEEYIQFINELRNIHIQQKPSEDEELKGLRHRKLPPIGYEAIPYE